MMTDADIELSALRRVFRRAADRSFNAVSVDGCMSTNDTAIILANGCAGNKTLKNGTKDIAIFEEMLSGVMSDLAVLMVKDGEGATKVVEMVVEEAKTTSEAGKIAYAIANSNLVKTAFYGCDPNWGRIISAAGAIGIDLPANDVKLFFEDVPIFAGGCGLAAAKTTGGIMKRIGSRLRCVWRWGKNPGASFSPILVLIM